MGQLILTSPPQTGSLEEGVESGVETRMETGIGVGNGHDTVHINSIIVGNKQGKWWGVDGVLCALLGKVGNC